MALQFTIGVLGLLVGDVSSVEVFALLVASVDTVAVDAESVFNLDECMPLTTILKDRSLFNYICCSNLDEIHKLFDISNTLYHKGGRSGVRFGCFSQRNSSTRNFPRILGNSTSIGRFYCTITCHTG